MAQIPAKSDSLRQAYNRNPGSREQMDAAAELARMMALQYPDSAFVLLDQALTIARKLDDKESEAKILFRKIVSLRLHGDQEKALQLNRTVLPLADNPASGPWGGKIYHTLSHFYMEDLAGDSCLYFLQKAESLNIQRERPMPTTWSTRISPIITRIKNWTRSRKAICKKPMRFLKPS